MSFVQVTAKNRKEFLPQIQALEESAEYPLGDDFFKIDHGSDYFKFFDRLGNLKYYVWLEGNQVAAVAAGILRKVPYRRGFRNAWYLCDLKVHKDFRGQRIPLRMLTRCLLPNYFFGPRGYAISMNASGEKANRVARMLNHFRWAPIKYAVTLQLWSLTKAEMLKVKPLIERHRGPVSYLSLAGVKDIVLQSTNRPMPLLHVQFGSLADPRASIEATDGAIHMFCAPEGDPLSREVVALGFAPSSTATVVAHRMRDSDWTWILTSDI